MANECEVCGMRLASVGEYFQHMNSEHTIKDIYDAGHEKGKNNTANHIAWLSLVVAIFLGGGSVLYARQNESRLEWERTHQNANKVYLGEAPQYYYGTFEERDQAREAGDITWVVINASGVELDEVWIEAENDKWLEIDGIQRCTLYDVPIKADDGTSFDPIAVHFKDTYGRWRRTAAGELTPDGRTFPDGDDHGTSNPMGVEDCNP